MLGYTAGPQEHGVHLMLSTGAEPAWAYGDEHRLMQVMANLLSNAIKFSPTASTVHVGVTAGPAGSWRITVRDSGAGIPKAFHARIFQRFAQADSSDAREKGGTGLGLSIVQAVVERHAGKVSFHSLEGRGTEFRVDIPARTPISADSEAASSTTRLLICEDNADAAFDLAELVRENGYACDTVATVAAARLALDSGQHAALLLDLKLPGGDGLNLVRELRGSIKHRQLPIVIISGSDQGDREPGLVEASAVADWLQRPVERDRLASVLSRLFSAIQPVRILLPRRTHP